MRIYASRASVSISLWRRIDIETMTSPSASLMPRTPVDVRPENTRTCSSLEIFVRLDQIRAAQRLASHYSVEPVCHLGDCPAQPTEEGIGVSIVQLA